MNDKWHMVNEICMSNLKTNITRFTLQGNYKYMIYQLGVGPNSATILAGPFDSAKAAFNHIDGDK